MSLDQKQVDPAANVKAQITAAHRPVELIVLALAFSIAIYTIIGLVLLSTGEQESEASGFRIPFFVAALFLSLGSITLRRTQFRWIKLQAVADARGVAGLLRHLANVTIISAILAEVVGILGLLISFFGGGRNEVIIFGAIGLMVALSCYPRRAAWERAANYFAATGAVAGQGTGGEDIRSSG